MSLRVVSPGFLTTVQDLGRSGHRAAGIPPSGAMDPWAAELANRLVGNAPDAALLEATLVGPELLAEQDLWLAIISLGSEPAVAGRRIDAGRAEHLAPGQRLDLRRLGTGARAYLAVAGGLAVAPVLGSRSTYLRGGFGGLAGRALRAGDRLALGGRRGAPLACHDLAPLLAPRGSALEVRALRGPQWSEFEPESQELFFAADWRFSPRSDRVGLRLEGPALHHRLGHEIPPEGLVLGAVQVPASGEPIVLGPDLPTTGSYAKIATVIAADRGALAYAQPGDRIRFRACDFGEARRALAARRSEIEQLLGGEG